MSVYVDELINWPSSHPTFKGRKSCHMYADTIEELEEMAAKIGLRKSWIQNSSDFIHYDLVPSKRAAAVFQGALEKEWGHPVRLMREKRNEN